MRRLAYGLWFDGLRRLPVTAAALLGEAFTWWQLSGFGLVLAALVAGQVEPVQGGRGAISSRRSRVRRVVAMRSTAPEAARTS